MKFAAFTSIALSGSMAAAALQSLTEYTNDIPSCVVPYLPDALKSEGCDLTTIDASDFDCFCKHISAIAVILVGKVPATCSADFAQAAGSMCGIWQIEGKTASDIAQATKALGDKLGGKGGAPAATPTGSAGSGGSAPSSKNLAAAPTAGVVGLMGGAAAAVAMML